MNELTDTSRSINLASKFYKSTRFIGYSLPWFVYGHRQVDRTEHAYRWSNIVKRWVG